MKKGHPAKTQRLDVVPNEPIDGIVIWFMLDEAAARALANGIVSQLVREHAEACIAWLDDDHAGYVERSAQ